MTVHYRQAARAALTLVAHPFDFAAAMRLVHGLGDLGIVHRLYARLTAGLDPAARERLRALTDRPLDEDALLALPPRSLGHQLARWMRDNRLSWTAQVDAFPPFAETLESSWELRRFARVHDIHHVLFGFRVDPPGELGLQVFNLRNFGEPFGLLGLVAAPLSIRAYGRPRAHLAEVVRGWRQGARAPDLFVFPFEEHLADDVDDLRARFGAIPPPGGFGAAWLTPPETRSDRGGPAWLAAPSPASPSGPSASPSSPEVRP